MFLTELPIIQILSVILFSLVIFGLIGSLDYFTPHFIKSHLSRGYKKTSDSVTDKEILLLIQNQKSGYLSPKELSKNFEISLKDANVRLKYLEYLKTISSKENKYSNTHFYYLNDSISKAPYPTLSEKPFITTSDLIVLFQHFKGKLSLQNICLATGLPIEIILKEFETFESVGLIYRLDDSHSAFFILNENFDFDSNSLFKGAEELDLKLKEISLQKKK